LEPELRSLPPFPPFSFFLRFRSFFATPEVERLFSRSVRSVAPMSFVTHQRIAPLKTKLFFPASFVHFPYACPPRQPQYPQFSARTPLRESRYFTSSPLSLFFSSHLYYFYLVLPTTLTFSGHPFLQQHPFESACFGPPSLVTYHLRASPPSHPSLAGSSPATRVFLATARTLLHSCNPQYPPKTPFAPRAT